MPSVLIAFPLAGLMLAAGVDSIVAKPSTRVPDERRAITESQFSRQFGDWREASQGYERVVNPKTKKLFDLINSMILVSIYEIADRYCIMQNGNHG
jgi:hypothetical protein